MRHPDTYGKSRGGANLCAILDNMDARKLHIPRYYEEKLHRFHFSINQVLHADMDNALKLRIFQLLLQDLRANLVEMQGHAALPIGVLRKLKTHGQSVCVAHYRMAVKLVELARRQEASRKAKELRHPLRQPDFELSDFEPRPTEGESKS